MIAQLWQRRDLLLLLVIEADLLLGLWPDNPGATLQHLPSLGLLLARLLIGSLAWWFVWARLWRKQSH